MHAAPRVAAFVGIALLVASCSRSKPAAGDPDAGRPRLQHDFGTVPHGGQPVWLADVPIASAIGYRISAFSSSCSCARGSFVLTRDGRETELPAFPTDDRRLRDGDRLQLRIALDTASREPVDTERQTVPGAVLLEKDRHGDDRIEIPVLFHFAIDAPVAIRPTALIDVGSLPRTTTYRETLELIPDRATIRLGEVETTDPRLTAALRREAGSWLLDVTLRAAPDQAPLPFQLAVRIGTDLPNDYTIEIPVTGEFAPDVQVLPMPKISFGRVEPGRAVDRFVNVTDHDASRAADFEVQEISAFGGHLEARFEEIDGDPRSRRLYVRYRGTLEPAQAPGGEFRGEIRIGKPGSPVTLTSVSFVGFLRGPTR